MKPEVNQKIKDSYIHLRRSGATIHLLKTCLLDPNIIIVTSQVEDLKEKWETIKSGFKKLSIVGEYRTSDPEFVDINSDLTGLNRKNKPIFFDGILITD